MITCRQRTVSFAATTVLIVLAASPCVSGNTALSNQQESAFATRMMTMDRNKDGFLTDDELPKSLLKGIASADLNKDGKWSVEELSTVSQQAMKHRANESATPDNSKPGEPKENRSGRGRLGRGPARPDTGPGSPLDAAQILKFALTFDLDKDSGLNPVELRKYATALATRRSRARRLRESESHSPKASQDASKNGLAIPLPEAPDRSVPAKKALGLKSKSDSRDRDPFGSRKKP